MTRALMIAATAESASSHPPIRRMLSGRSARGHTIGTLRAVPMPDPVSPTTASSMVPIAGAPFVSTPFGQHKVPASAAACASSKPTS